MSIHPNFPKDPCSVIHPHERYRPSDEALRTGSAQLSLPPLVDAVRCGVKKWRESGYAGASSTSRILLDFWFHKQQGVNQSDSPLKGFRWYFAQQEAVESVIWLYEVEEARSSEELSQYASEKDTRAFASLLDWPRYVTKLATGSGKTKVISLLIAWSYYHSIYERSSSLATNFLLTAPNIIVMDRLFTDFGDLRIFRHDPIIPEDGYNGRNWSSDFQMQVHVQDDVRTFSATGNIFLTNVHRIYPQKKINFENSSDLTEIFLGNKPAQSIKESGTSLADVLAKLPDLMIVNDEAHHFHSADQASIRGIFEISERLGERDKKISIQLDLSATPRNPDGSLFEDIVSDYPLVEAIRQQVVKTPLLPDQDSQVNLQEYQVESYAERYRDYLAIGVEEWRKSYNLFITKQKKPILFVMTDDTKKCDEVAQWLEKNVAELRDSVLVVHTKDNGEIDEDARGKNQDELRFLRHQSKVIDSLESPYKAIVSVMVLREGWDVQNVVSIVGLRPFSAESKILPEQTLGRGLRLMFREERVKEKVSVIGTPAFIAFVETIREEGVELEYTPMGSTPEQEPPMVLQIDHTKDLVSLDISLPNLSARIKREHRYINHLDVEKMESVKLTIPLSLTSESKEISFVDFDTNEISHTTVISGSEEFDIHDVLSHFTKILTRELRLLGDSHILYEKISEFIEQKLYSHPVSLGDLRVLKSLATRQAYDAIMRTMREAINTMTVIDTGVPACYSYVRLSLMQPHMVKCQPYMVPKKSLLNKAIGNRGLELPFASFLDRCSDILSFTRNDGHFFTIEYKNSHGLVATYIPDFIVKQDEKNIWIIETKGREDSDDRYKFLRLQQWCEDASAADSNVSYKSMYVREKKWKDFTPSSFKQFISLYMTEEDKPLSLSKPAESN